MRSHALLNAPGADWNPLQSGERWSASQGASAFGALYRQLQGEVHQFIEQGGGPSAAAQLPSLSAEGQWRALQQSPAAGGTDSAQQQSFVDAMTPLAQAAASQLGVAPEVLVAHAALETGWGQQPIRRADGSDAHNLFGVKAGGAWRGESVTAATTEYEDGAAQAQQASFRAYPGPAQSFQDLAQMLGANPRYRAALGTGNNALAYGQALQRGGYATDPAYADKLAKVAAKLQGAHP